MFRTKKGKEVQRVIWRISQDHPEGVLVQASDSGFRPARPSEVHERGFVVSSLDLMHGADVTETPIDTLPGELMDAFAQDDAVVVPRGSARR